ncbi:polyadenylate-binding protein-interacting protein 7 [Phtheirospermum japonicum]|uniref:Polyadenylate-binding protein-interacting protein 7 n=1 Tax=Phtheirospermum japonicum TaxID=374723 RepID=A0A830BTY2_9LAMI|nr:polyadenylate-binding protein-interacting protein 7 [Phtheirospermum japonicum]
MGGEDVSPLEFLASQFPGFAAESLTEVYFASGGDLNLTIEMLTQLELQVDLDALSNPNLSPLDFPALSVNSQNGLAKFGGDDHLSVGPFQSPDKDSSFLFRSFPAIPSRGATDFASAVRKTAPQEPSTWEFDNKCSSDTSIGSSRSLQVLGSSYNNGQGRGTFGNTVQNQGQAHAAPIWLETSEAVGNMYAEMRGEARDHALIRKAYFEQARQAYLIGNKALTKELSIRRQMHNIQMKEPHEKAQESIYHQRNTSDMQANRRERMIDLHGLHMSEAIHVLKRELAVFRNAARSVDLRLLVYICVGIGHHTRGSWTPSRLPTAVQRYLLEEEGLDFSEPQPGLLRVLIC